MSPPVGPQLPSVLATRPNLVALLAASPVPLTILRAPLGFGKTTLIAQYLREHSDPQASVAWLRVSADSATAESFWPAVLDALAESGIVPLPGRGHESMRSQARHALAQAGRPITLVLDDADQLAAEGLDHELLMILRDSPLLRLIVCLRGGRHFRPALHVDIDGLTITAEDLRFGVEETEQLLRLCAVDSPAHRAEGIHTAVGGWPELTRACALALGPQRDSSQPQSGLDDAERAAAVAAAYLRDRVLPALGGAEILDFALATSVVDAVSADLAARLTDDDPELARTRLRRLAADGLLFTETTDQFGPYRWPPAARHALYREAQRRDPARVLLAHGTAAIWFLDHDQAGPALLQATAARDWPLVLRTIEERWEDLILAARPALVAAFGVVPEQIVESSLLGRIVRSFALSTKDPGLPESLPALPDDLARLEELGQEPDVLARIRLASAVMIALRAHGHHGRASAQAERLTVLAEAASVAHSVDVSARLPGLMLQVGVTHLWAGEFAEARQALRRAYELAPHSRNPYVGRDAAGKLALLLVIQGQTERAAPWFERHEAAQRSWGWIEERINASGLVARAWSALDRLDLPAAALALGGIDSDAIAGHELSAAVAYLEAMYRLHTNGMDQALHELSRANSTFPAIHEPNSFPLALLTAMRAELLLALGRGNQARALIAAAPDHQMVRVAHARLLLMNGNLAGAIGIANDFTWLNNASPVLTVEMLVIKAVAHHRNGQCATATATLGNALSAARSSQLRRPFAAFPRAELLAIAEALPTQATELLLHPALDVASVPFPDHVDLVNLTERERLILTHLAAGQRGQDIATQLFLSYNTVRTYLRQIYKKLSVNSREQAVAQARSYGLIPS